ncbi:28S ribosomal protein S30, mitochondrial [Pseudolycoriella hygida]|uniref:28S ribosomal protein S30, mitochondrial n=1 Tax=Pseudolycoriella hygida TaxID=35572 RepID=A0A9Q0RXW8_9DIPT|nr:28S ribosomal protein S30, mitochondrial [Pseudolycoriella hygida]
MSLYIKFGQKVAISKLILNNCRHLFKRSISTIGEDDEYTKEPQYPPIVDTSYKARKQRERVKWHEMIKCLNTVEEKLFAINMPRYYGFKSVILSDDRFQYNSLPFFKYCTRTVLVDSGLPQYYDKLNEKVEGLLPHVKSGIEEAVLSEYVANKCKKKFKSKRIAPEQENRSRTSRVVSRINDTLSTTLMADAPHLSEAVEEADTRHEAFWFVGGIDPPERIRKMRENTWQKEYANDPVDRNFQYSGSPLLTLRHELPLESPLQFENFSKDDLKKVPEFTYDPATIGYFYKHRPATTIPGVWPSEQEEFGLVSYHSRDYIPLRNAQYGAEECQEAIHSQAILSSYAWVFGQACYQGFSTYHDPTYPLSTQTIITDGKLWSFYAYQLNTTRLNIDSIEKNQKVNQCWGTKEMKLFEEITEDGKVIGLNDDVIRNMIKFYINEPRKRDIDMKPYLGGDEKKIADMKHQDRRVFMEEHYKNLFSGRPRNKLVPEIYPWEKIYKVDHNTMPMVARRRFFELNVNPFRRTLDDHRPKYVPKDVRPGGKKNRDKYETTYYPCKYEQKHFGYVSTFNRKYL